jgi:hypothetical protein
MNPATDKHGTAPAGILEEGRWVTVSVPEGRPRDSDRDLSNNPM